MTLDAQVAAYVSVSRQILALYDARDEVRRRERQLRRAIARLQIVRFDLANQLCTGAALDEVRERLGYDAVIDPPTALDYEYARDAAQLIDRTTKRRRAEVAS